jgi:hypothetical protein
MNMKAHRHLVLAALVALAATACEDHSTNGTDTVPNPNNRQNGVDRSYPATPGSTTTGPAAPHHGGPPGGANGSAGAAQDPHAPAPPAEGGAQH